MFGRRDGNRCRMAVDEVAGGIVDDDWFAILLKLTEDLFASKCVKIASGRLKDGGAGLVDGGENKS